MATSKGAKSVVALDALTSATLRKTSAYTTTAADRFIEVTGTTTISLLSAASAPTGYVVGVSNAGTATVTVALITATDTLAGQVNGTVPLAPGQSMNFSLAQSTGYDVSSDSGFAPVRLTSVAGTNTITAAAPANLPGYYIGLIVLLTPANTNSGATTINITPAGGSALGAKNFFWNASACAGGEIRQNVPCAGIYDGTQFNLLSQVGATGQNLCEGRLTLTSGTPVTTADVTGAGTLYFSPYAGNRIALYDGSSAWAIVAFTELSLALTLSSGKPYDIFCYNNAGVATLESLVWTNDTTRATALTTQNGVLVKTGATTRRYVGTIYSSGANTTEDSIAKRFVWNYYNRVRRPMRVRDTTDSWNYTTATWRQANASVANQLDFVIGVSEDAVEANVIAQSNNGTAAVDRASGIGVDSTTAPSELFGNNAPAAGAYTCTAAYRGFPGVGRHYLAWLEFSSAAGTSTWYGDAGVSWVQSGITGAVTA